MNSKTEEVVAKVLNLVSRMRTFRCRYQDLSFHPEVDAQRIVEVRGDSEGRLRLSTVSGTPEIDAVITPEELIRIDHTNRSAYRIDFSRHSFTDFHRYGWLRPDRPFVLFSEHTIQYRCRIEESAMVYLFQAQLSPSFLTASGSGTRRVPVAQFKLDARTGLLRELLVFTKSSPQRFVFTHYSVNKKLGKDPFELRFDREIGDMTELYWNQIQLAQKSPGSPMPFLNWN